MLTLGGLVAAFVAVVLLAGTRSVAAVGSVAIDGPTLFLQGTIVLVAILSVLLMAEREVENAPAREAPGSDSFAPQPSAVPGSVAEREAATAGAVLTEVYPLTMFAVGGMMLFPAANDLLTMFVALEVFSLPLYLLCGLARRRRLLSQEAAMKYFLLGAFSSAFFLFGVALLYGYAGTVDLAGIADAVALGTGSDTLAITGIALVVIGLLFKVGAVPFHSWIPDVYQGAPTSVTAFMASATKIAAFGAILRVFFVAVPELRDDWRPVLAAIAILTMVVGSIMAITQNDVKRMLAYSSIAHAGFILTGVVAANQAGVSATLFYLFAYGFSTVGAFAVLTLVRDLDGEANEMARWAGLGRRSPVIGGVFALSLFAFAGIPLTSGFISKFVVFGAAAAGDAVAVVVVGVICSAIAAYFYIRVIVLMFFTDPPDDAPTVVIPSPLTTVTIAVATAVTILLGILPQPLLDLAERASVFVR